MRQSIKIRLLSFSMVMISVISAASAESSYATPDAPIMIGNCADKSLLRIFEGNQALTPNAFHNQLAKLLGFPDYYGKNLDALEEILRDGFAGYADPRFWDHSVENDAPLDFYFNPEAPLAILWKDSNQSRHSLGDDYMDKILAVFTDVLSDYPNIGFCIVLI